jgi:hypothetical protein
MDCNCGEPLKDLMFGMGLKKFTPSFGGGTTSSEDDQQDGGEDKDNHNKEKVAVKKMNDGSCSSSSSSNNDDDDDDDDDDDEEEDQKRLQEQYRKQQQQNDGMKDDENEESTTNKEQGQTEDDEDVFKMLDDMSIPDFQLSVDFDEFEKKQKTRETTTTAATVINYDERLTREEVYSKRYHPSKEEKKELQDLASVVGVATSSGFRLTSTSSVIQELLFGNHSIILKRGPICCNTAKDDCELYLLTDGFALVSRRTSSFNIFGSGNRLKACHLWTDVDYVEQSKPGVLSIHLVPSSADESLQLYAATDGEDLKSWMKAMEHVLIQHVMFGSDNSNNKNPLLKQTFGWQHIVVRRPGFTAAVTGDMRLMGSPTNINELDTYNQSSPLHYALRYQPSCNAEIVEALLLYGADPNLPDGDGRSAMYFAQRNKLDDIESMLVEHGGTASTLAEMELRGELFGGVEQAQRNAEKRREHERAIEDRKAADAAAKAQSVQSQMGQNMAAMIERGQKIEQMDDKARQLNDEAKNYADLASQLKNTVKNKKWYQL